MQYKKTEYIEHIEQFVDEYKEMNGGNTPSVREIAAEVGLAISTISSYLNYMREQGIISYDGLREVIPFAAFSGGHCAL